MATAPKLKRRKFLDILGFGSIIALSPISLFSKNLDNQANSKLKDICNLLKKKRDSIKTLSYSILRKVVYIDQTKAHKSDRDEFLSINNMKTEVCWKSNKSKMVMYFPSEKLPHEFGLKITSVCSDKKAYEKREFLDGSFKPESHSGWMTSSEWEKAQRLPRDTILPMPKDSLMTLEKEDSLDGDPTYIIVQGNMKYWISLKKIAAVKIEIYQRSNWLFRALEFKSFEEVYPGFLISTSVIQKEFDDKNNLVKEARQEITGIRVNEFMSDEIFELEEGKYE